MVSISHTHACTLCFGPRNTLIHSIKYLVGIACHHVRKSSCNSYLQDACSQTGNTTPTTLGGRVRWGSMGSWWSTLNKALRSTTSVNLHHIPAPLAASRKHHPGPSRIKVLYLTHDFPHGLSATISSPWPSPPPSPPPSPWPAPYLLSGSLQLPPLISSRPQSNLRRQSSSLVMSNISG